MGLLPCGMFMIAESRHSSTLQRPRIDNRTCASSRSNENDVKVGCCVLPRCRETSTYAAFHTYVEAMGLACWDLHDVPCLTFQLCRTDEASNSSQSYYAVTNSV